VGDLRKPISIRDSALQFLRETFLDLHYFGAIRADQVMMMLIVRVPHQFEASDSIPKIKSLHHSHFYQQMYGSVNRREIASGLPHASMDLPNRERMRLFLQRRYDRTPWSGNLPRFSAQSFRDRLRHFPGFMRMRMMTM
jgi:hypothetical protein